MSALYECFRRTSLNSTEYSPHWDANTFSAGQEIHPPPSLHGTRRFIPLLARSSLLPISWATPTPFHPICWKSVVITLLLLPSSSLSSYHPPTPMYPCGLSPQVLPPYPVFTCTRPIRATYLAHLKIIEWYLVKSKYHANPHYAIFSIPVLPFPS